MTGLPALTLRSDALAVIASATWSMTADLETGGVLLGKDTEGQLLVTRAGDPGPDAVHESHFFSRDTAHASMLAEEAWSLDRSRWIGEWHTHPKGLAVPSELDVRSYRQHLRDADLDFRRFVSLIVLKQGDSSLFLTAWIVTLTSLTPAKIERQTDE